MQVAELLKKVEKYDTIIKNNGNSSMDKKQTNLTVVYYNQSFGFMIVPYAIERNMKCRIAIEPTIILPTKISQDELGNAVKNVIKIAANAPEVDIENDVNEFWKKTKYKGFRGFSNHFQSININQCENLLRIEKWVSTAQKGYVKDSTQKTTEISAKISDSELGAIIKNVFHREN